MKSRRTRSGRDLAFSSATSWQGGGQGRGCQQYRDRKDEAHGDREFLRRAPQSNRGAGNRGLTTKERHPRFPANATSKLFLESIPLFFFDCELLGNFFHFRVELRNAQSQCEAFNKQNENEE